MSLCFDIGANVGDTVQWFLNNNYSKVIAVEPGAGAFSQLFNRYHNDPRVIMHYLALSSQSKVIDFWDCSFSGTSTAHKEWMTESRFAGKFEWFPCTKNAITLDKLIEMHGRPDFIKVDVESYELEVFKGMTKHIPCGIGFEWAEEEYAQLNNIVEYLKALYYTQFSFTYCDQLSDMEKLVYTDWDKLDLHLDIIPSRKEKWGMIYAK
jgi:FkbM family methyltransferase